MPYLRFRRRSCVLVLAATTLVSAIPLRSQSKIEAEVVFLVDGGFSPSKITRRPGLFLLVIKNRSHSSQMQLGVTKQDGTVIAATESVVDSNRDYLLDLPASTYVLRDAAHPSWTPLTIIRQ